MSDKKKKNTDNENTMIIPDNGDTKIFKAQMGVNNGYQQNPMAQQPPQNGRYPAQPMNGQYPQGQPVYPNQQQYPQNQQYPNYPPQQQPYPQNYDQAPPPPYGQQYAPPRQSPPKKGKAPKKKKKKSLLKKILLRTFLSLFTIFIVIFGVYSCTALSIISKLKLSETGSRNRTADAISKNYVKSVLIIGTDGRGENDRGRSDSMILLSFNSKSDKMIMTSFMRDTYVDIPGHGMNKLNAAYAFGGPELLMDTIEKNFLVKIDNYMSFNFTTFASVIDAAGGVEIKISKDEAAEINKLLSSNEMNKILDNISDDDILDVKDGKVHLNGKQALCYSRIRHVGNNDFERTSRQRRVMSSLMDKAKKSGPSFISDLSKNAVPYITTNISKKDLYLFSLRLPFCLLYDKDQVQIPVEGSYSGEMIGGQSVLTIDFAKNRKEIKDKVFSTK